MWDLPVPNQTMILPLTQTFSFFPSPFGGRDPLPAGSWKRKRWSQVSAGTRDGMEVSKSYGSNGLPACTWLQLYIHCSLQREGVWATHGQPPDSLKGEGGEQQSVRQG